MRAEINGTISFLSNMDADFFYRPHIISDGILDDVAEVDGHISATFACQTDIDISQSVLKVEGAYYDTGAGQWYPVGCNSGTAVSFDGVAVAKDMLDELRIVDNSIQKIHMCVRSVNLPDSFEPQMFIAKI